MWPGAPQWESAVAEGRRSPAAVEVEVGVVGVEPTRPWDLASNSGAAVAEAVGFLFPSFLEG